MTRRPVVRPSLTVLAVVLLAPLLLAGCADPGPGPGKPRTAHYYTVTTETIRRAAESGDAGAAVNLGRFYELGQEGFPVRKDEAARLYRYAADHGNAAGLTDLGVFYATGQVVKQSDSEATRLWALAAAQNFEPAQRYLAAFYVAGRGNLASDDPAAIAALRATVARTTGPRKCDDGWAVLAMARLYETGGGGVRRDLDEAIRLVEGQANSRAVGGCEREEAKARLAALYEQKRSKPR